MLDSVTPTASGQSIAPWEEPPDHLNESSIPSISHQPPTAHSSPPWTGDRPSQMPSSVFGASFYNNDSSEQIEQISPGNGPDNGMGFPTDGEPRRPSIASATTIDSTGSKRSLRGRMDRKLRGILGDEFPGLDGTSESRQNSESSSMQGSLSAFVPGIIPRHRNNSLNDAMGRSRPPSPTFSRPRTPAPSSDVTPWDFQDHGVSGLCVEKGRSADFSQGQPGPIKLLRSF